jgi:hypothetical protein
VFQKRVSQGLPQKCQSHTNTLSYPQATIPNSLYKDGKIS